MSFYFNKSDWLSSMDKNPMTAFGQFGYSLTTKTSQYKDQCAIKTNRFLSQKQCKLVLLVRLTTFALSESDLNSIKHSLINSYIYIYIALDFISKQMARAIHITNWGVNARGIYLLFHSIALKLILLSPLVMHLPFWH